MIQDIYQEFYHSSPQSIIMDKWKQKKGVIQDKEVFLYKLYTILSKPKRLKTSIPVFITDKINNLEMILKLITNPVTPLFNNVSTVIPSYISILSSLLLFLMSFLFFFISLFLS